MVTEKSDGEVSGEKVLKEWIGGTGISFQTELRLRGDAATPMFSSSLVKA